MERSALYTEFYYQYLENFSHPETELNLFPEFNIEGLGINLKMSNLALERWKYMEIGAETEILFHHNLMMTIHEAQLKYIPAIDLYIKNYKDLTNRVVKENLNINKSGSANKNIQENNMLNIEDNNANKNYLNPINANGDESTLQDKNTRENQVEQVANNQTSQTDNKQSIENGYRERAISYFKSNPEILESAMKIKSIYFEALAYMDKAFMGVV